MINFKRIINEANRFAYKFIDHEHCYKFKGEMFWIHEDRTSGYGKVLECKYCGKELYERNYTKGKINLDSQHD